MTQCTPIPLVFTREEIEAGLTWTPVRRLNALLDPATARRHRQRVVLGFAGFNGTADTLYEQPRVRQWMRELDAHWPYWFFFVDPSSASLWLLMLLLCPLEHTPYEIEVDDAPYRQFFESHLAAMDALCGVLGDAPSTRAAMKEAIRHALL